MKSEIDLYIINKVREKRLEIRLSQANLAFELEVSISFIGKIESIKYNTHFNIKHINKLAKIFECSPKDFFPEKPL